MWGDNINNSHNVDNAIDIYNKHVAVAAAEADAIKKACAKHEPSMWKTCEIAINEWVTDKITDHGTDVEEHLNINTMQTHHPVWSQCLYDKQSARVNDEMFLKGLAIRMEAWNAKKAHVSAWVEREKCIQISEGHDLPRELSWRVTKLDA